MKSTLQWWAVRFSALLLTAGAASTEERPPLREAFADQFRIGVAVTDDQVMGRAPAEARLIARHFNTITPENLLKWESVKPEPHIYMFEASDAFAAFGERHDLFMVGHALVWHQQTPAWVFQDDEGRPATREVLLARMKEHIDRVVGRYRGRIQAWDVVNEALNADGSLRDSPWRKIIGDDYIERAFMFAHAADPAAELYYNDYEMVSAPKRAGAIALVRRLQAAGVPITGIGAQQHFSLDYPTLQAVEDTFAELGALGIKVMVTELDLTVLPNRSSENGAEVSRREAAAPELNPYAAGLPVEVQAQLARRYADLFAIYRRHQDVLDRVTLWGLQDGKSWRNNWPIPGRTDYPLLFDRDLLPKPAFWSILAP